MNGCIRISGLCHLAYLLKLELDLLKGIISFSNTYTIDINSETFSTYLKAIGFLRIYENLQIKTFQITYLNLSINNIKCKLCLLCEMITLGKTPQYDKLCN